METKKDIESEAGNSVSGKPKFENGKLVSIKKTVKEITKELDKKEPVKKVETKTPAKNAVKTEYNFDDTLTLFEKESIIDLAEPDKDGDIKLSIGSKSFGYLLSRKYGVGWLDTKGKSHRLLKKEDVHNLRNQLIEYYNMKGITEKALTPFYHCPHDKCPFTTSSDKEMIEHLKTH